VGRGRYVAVPRMEQTEASYLSTIKAQDIAIPFAPLDIPSQWTRRLLSAVVIMLVASMVGDLMQNELLSRAKNGNVSKSEAAAEDAREEVIGGLYLLAVAVAGIAFLVWFRRAWRNLKSLGGRDLKYSTAWVVGGFFVPIMNLYRPIQVMREVWHGSNPSNLERDLQPDGPEIRKSAPNTSVDCLVVGAPGRLRGSGEDRDPACPWGWKYDRSATPGEHAFHLELDGMYLCSRSRDSNRQSDHKMARRAVEPQSEPPG